MYYPTYEEDETRIIDAWVERLMEKFVPSKNDHDVYM